MEGIKLKKIVEDLNLQKIFLANNYEDVSILTANLNRPGLQLAGYYNKFDSDRLQILGEQEWTYIDEMELEKRYKSLKKLFEYNIPALIFSGNNWIHDEVIELAKINNVSLLRTTDSFIKFAGRFQSYIEIELAPTIRKHAVLLDVYGVGVLITGKSGIGKSETALDLISKGSKLISDDSVIIKKIDDRLIGKSPSITKHFMEIRGVGIIDIQRIFGIGYVMESKEIEMIVNLENWDDSKEYDRLGIDNNYEEILGKKIPIFSIPVKPGRHTSLIVEVATKNFKQKEMGYNPAYELNKRILQASKK
ncbi:HPr(Ser) kinase/phosphatase [Peptoniphilus mikwangii]|uniref:HPr(Ser) kinase/phosphatase n=1 Tax=Peptoniphilus mikwangii TaxID=1354300 RepID=UPI000400C462|nr:HPr(Ser) kinase/phosphatase [Peptoniphilus mikwangii]